MVIVSTNILNYNFAVIKIIKKCNPFVHNFDNFLKSTSTKSSELNKSMSAFIYFLSNLWKKCDQFLSCILGLL